MTIRSMVILSSALIQWKKKPETFKTKKISLRKLDIVLLFYFSSVIYITHSSSILVKSTQKKSYL